MTHYLGDTVLYVAHRNRPNRLNHVVVCKSNAMDKIIAYIKEERNNGAIENSMSFLSNIYRNGLNII